MKSMKVKLLKKLKTIKIVGHNSKQERVLRLKASDGYVHLSPPSTPAAAAPPHSPLSPICLQEKEEEEPEIIEVSELMKDLEDEEMEFLDEVDDKENIRPVSEAKNSENLSPLKPKIEAFYGKELQRGDSRFPPPLSEIDVSTFRFLQAAIEAKIQHLSSSSEEEEEEEEEEQEPPTKAQKLEENTNPLLDFEEKCPPGGSDSVILYTTGLRGVRKTYEDCQNTRFLLENFRVLFFERDISMHSEFKEELWGILGQKVVPPRLFIKGRYIGGAERVFGLHQQGKFKALLQGIPLDVLQEPCGGCGGMRFILCFRCHGSRKVHVDDDKNGDDDDDEWKKKCPECNENGLIVCPLCC
ncbi:PREDICTED: uncharacterized protein At3g28850-like isoform X2 [Ipomoea nil]|uniref:uncharacterized protein At3g28850-like isoform X2 n=1 Tax=Ipomoea nil TaxID=35883 RepID=UPI0009014B56|nr:PREDICTED: uncharacterized protein At3g28850-like isoform X2 [Ipomoea nil]